MHKKIPDLDKILGWSERVWNWILSPIAGVLMIGGTGGLTYYLTKTSSFLIDNPAFIPPIFIFLICTILWLRLLLSKNRMIREQNSFVSKLDDEDLCRLLGATIYQNICFFSFDNHIAEFKGAKEINSLSEKNYKNIQVRAPKNSWVSVNFQFYGMDVDVKETVFILDEKLQPKKIDIYQNHSVFLDRISNLYFRVEFEGRVPENASLTITFRHFSL